LHFEVATSLINDNYPGTLQHQVLLKGIVQHYAADPRIRAVVLFGSLGRGNWDADSDIDLDVITGDQAKLDVAEELSALCDALAATGEKAVLIFADGPDEGEVVFESLMQLSVRYHPLSSTKPAIVEGMRLLAGDLDPQTIAAAGLANQSDDHAPLRPLLDRLLRYAAATDVALRRQNLWLAVELLGRMRGLCLELFTRAHGGERSFYFFERAADPRLQSLVGRTLPQFDPASLRGSLLAFIAILEDETPALTAGRLALRDADRRLLARVRQNQAS
jgi:predicted nucleotidyltransferase